MGSKADFDVFLSHSSQDKPWVDELVSELRTHGIRTWVNYDIAPGERVSETIADALRRSRTFVIVLSPHSVNSPWTFFEIGAAIADQKRIIPVIHEESEDVHLPSILRPYQFLREQSPTSAGKRLAAVLERDDSSFLEADTTNHHSEVAPGRGRDEAPNA